MEVKASRKAQAGVGAAELLLGVVDGLRADIVADASPLTANHELQARREKGNRIKSGYGALGAWGQLDSLGLLPVETREDPRLEADARDALILEDLGIKLGAEGDGEDASSLEQKKQTLLQLQAHVRKAASESSKRKEEVALILEELGIKLGAEGDGEDASSLEQKKQTLLQLQAHVRKAATESSKRKEEVRTKLGTLAEAKYRYDEEEKRKIQAAEAADLEEKRKIQAAAEEAEKALQAVQAEQVEKPRRSLEGQFNQEASRRRQNVLRLQALRWFFEETCGTVASGFDCMTRVLYEDLPMEARLSRGFSLPEFQKILCELGYGDDASDFWWQELFEAVDADGDGLASLQDMFDSLVLSCQ